MKPTHPMNNTRHLFGRLARVAAVFALLALATPAMAQEDSTPPPAEAASEQTQPQTQPQTPPVEARPRPAPRPAEFTDPIPLGSEDGDDKAHIRFTPYSAGIASLSLPDAYNAVGDTAHIELQAMATDPATGFVAVPFAVLGVEIEGDFVSLSGAQGSPIWAQVAPGVFVAHVDAPDGAPLLRITRTFALNGTDRYGFTVTTTLENLSAAPVNARLIQTGPIDLPEAENNYAGDKRRFRFGYLNPPERQVDLAVHVDERLDPRTELLGKRATLPNGAKVYPAQYAVWPNERTVARGQRLAWLAFSDRYFAVVVHPLFDPAAVTRPEDKLLAGLGLIDRLVLNPSAPAPQTVMVLRFNGDKTTIAPGASHTTRFGVYAGPMSRPTIRQDLLLASLRVPDLVVYNLGGMCAPCTFHWLTDALMGVLRLFHAVTGDWAVAIMLLVVLVRGVLHPVTRWSQIRMQKFGVQMQAMAPKQAKLKEKYKDDPKKLQQEMGKLWKEEGINPAGMLGCLPMFLQSPVWIALYATLFFAIELRQSPAFYGAFQTISGGNWEFLADLSVPDHAIPLPEFMHFSFPLWGAVQAINILPILMGALMWAHQKFLTPPTTAAMTPEQEQQQKIIKVMMVVMFPLMMYAAPAGLTIYFITNSALGIGEHKWIRAHMDKHGLLDPEKIKAERQSKGPGFMARLSEAAEAQKRLQAQAHGGRPPILPDKKRKKK